MMGRKLSCLLIVEFVLSTTVCNASSEIENMQSVLDSLAKENVENAVENTPFSAVVHHVDERRISGNHEDTIVFTLNVEEVIRGSDLKTLTYEMVVEKGESSELTKEAVIISLCHDEEGFFWPGTGSQSPLSSDLLRAANTAARKAKSDQATFDYCE